MNKILLIARREFLSRVQKKTFLLTTILLPLIIFGFYAMIIYFSVKSGDKTTIAVVDKANIFNGKIDNDNDITFSFLQNETPASLADKVKNDQYSGYIYIPETTQLSKQDSIQVVTAKSAGLITRENVQDQINKRLEEQRLLALNISKAALDSAQQSMKINFPTIGGTSSDEGKETVGYIVGYVSGFLIYIILFIYGTMVMRGVMEEKVSRIAEVIISSVKPFQLMMGKITGIGAVGLVQFIIWIILMVGTRFLVLMFFPSLLGASQGMEEVKNAASDPGILQGLSSVDWPMIIICFLFYFLGGYLLYSALFAAVGSAVNEDPQDAQSLMLPITMPIIFGIVIMTKAVNDPSSGLAVFGSIFPLTSPIVMIARVAHGVPDVVPYWQLFLSVALLILGFLGTTWLAAKIYRTGILMYGKKPTWKELIKWGFRKN
ncbi:MAG: ABC transporter permease [Chitinophagaceae bacterium]